MEDGVEHHRIAVDGVVLNYRAAGTGAPLVLIHGFPQTSYQWRSVMPQLARDFRVLAPDLRGIGGPPGPASGYDKLSLARDIRAIVKAEVGDTPAIICGHDMGSFVAFRYALEFPSTVAGLVLLDAPPPGTAAWQAGANSPRAWHINFHSQVDVALMLVSGRERAYIRQFVDMRAYDCSAVTEEAIDVYARAYSAPGAMRSAFEMYRALAEDAEHNRAALEKTKLEMPTMLVGGSMTMARPVMEAVVAEIATNGRVETIDRCGHWMSEEQPEALVRLLSDFAGSIGLR